MTSVKHLTDKMGSNKQKCMVAHASHCTSTTHRTAPVCVCEKKRAEKKVAAGHSQESLIWTGSAAAEVGGCGVRG